MTTAKKEEETILIPGRQIKATIEIDEVLKLLKIHYGISARTIIELDAYDDRNYRVLLDEEANKNNLPDNKFITSLSEHGYVLKIVNSLDTNDVGFYRAQTELLIYLDRNDVVCPVPVKQRDGSYFSTVKLNSGVKHLLRLLIFQPGDILNDLKTISATLLLDLGRFVATLNATLSDFSHPGYADRTSLWVLNATPRLRQFAYALKSVDDRELVLTIAREFEERVLPVSDRLEAGIIHGDLNESNIIVTNDGTRVAGVIDFGDSHVNCYVYELAICICYMITKANDVKVARDLIDGYASVRRLIDKERDILKLCVCARFAQSLTLGAYSHSREPDNDYLVRDADVKWTLLRKLWAMNNSQLMDLWGIKEAGDDELFVE